MKGVGALGAQTNLAHGFFGRDIENPLTGCRCSRSNFEQQGGLADAWLATQQNGSAGNDAAA